MRRLREHVHRLHPLEPIALTDESPEVAGERRRVAGDVDEPARPERDEGVEGLRMEPRAWRVGDDDLASAGGVRNARRNGVENCTFLAGEVRARSPSSARSAPRRRSPPPPPR